MESLVVVDAVGGDRAALDLLPVLRWSSKGKDVFPKLRESVTQRRHLGDNHRRFLGLSGHTGKVRRFR